MHIPGLHVNPPYFAAVFAAVVTIYFWRKNIIGIHESSEKALRIMQITTVMVVMLIVWCLLHHLAQRLPAGAAAHARATCISAPDALGWLQRHRLRLHHRHHRAS